MCPLRSYHAPLGECWHEDGWGDSGQWRRLVSINAVLGLWPTVSSWAHSPNGWLDARHTARTPTGPATPATVFERVSPLFLFWGELCRSPLLALLPSLCSSGARPSTVGGGFHETLC
jgi:hypothetical protein